MDKQRKKAVIYARVSSLGDRQNTTRQVQDLTQYAQANGYEIACKPFEEHISGAKKNEERPVLCECLEYCFTNHIDTLLISELSRLGRNVDEVLANVKACKDAHLNIYFQKEGLSIFQPDGTKNPFLTIFISVLGTCAEMERENIRFRLNSGRTQYIANGGKLGRKEGYRKPKEAKAEDYPEAIKMLKEAKALQEQGVKVPKLYTIRGIAETCKVGVSTVQRLKKEFNL
jgi:DNA invertase Pin-like site-specific DNA recombinase